jgi:anti-anti-sigma factor
MTPDSLTEPKLNLTDETLVLSGIVTHKTVAKVWKEGLSLIQKVKQLSVDLGGLRQCDSSGLALCVAWSRAAYQHNKNIQFINVPAYVRDLLRVYGLDKVLMIKNMNEFQS